MSQCLGFPLVMSAGGGEGQVRHRVTLKAQLLNLCLCRSVYFCTGLEIFMSNSKGRRCPGDKALKPLIQGWLCWRGPPRVGT